MRTTTVMLPRGFWADGVCHREAVVRALVGEDELYLQEVAASWLPAQRMSGLLARCLLRLGPFERELLSVVRGLSIGDREALLLHLYQLTFGDRVSCVLRCQVPACDAQMDLELSVADLIVEPGGEVGESHELLVEGRGERYRVRFRLPTGADAERAALHAKKDWNTALEQLLWDCVQSVEAGAGETCGAPMPAGVEVALQQALARLDPQAELLLDAACPECGERFSALFDVGRFLEQEATRAADQLLRDVHALALHYHWSEADILALSPARRRRYLGLLQEALA